eukprot:175925-Hanusia_phi.AAC.1
MLQHKHISLLLLPALLHLRLKQTRTQHDKKVIRHLEQSCALRGASFRHGAARASGPALCSSCLTSRCTSLPHSS